MGVVYRALDPELRREVALKVHRLGSAQTPNAARFRKRLFREGQALARVSDPNVVTVYDVGLFRGQVFVAMELVRGRTLGHWLHEEKRSSDAIIARYLGLASGLAAAHRAGLVHRDVKPANAIVGDDGRVRVVDFGLACGDIGVRSDVSLAATPVAGHKRLTENGMVMGTPAYIAPEQLAGEAVSERTDQFSFCVALWEALAGTLPFPAHSLQHRANAIESRSYEGLDKLPRPIRQILIRGLHPSPARRHSSMSALAAKLRRTQQRKRRRTRILLFVMVCSSFFYGMVRFAKPAVEDRDASQDQGARALDEVAKKSHSKEAIDKLLQFARRQMQDGHVSEAMITLDLVEEAEKSFGRQEIADEIEALRSRN
jgi:serine/threonine protein kinase